MKHAKGFVKPIHIFRTGVVLLENDYYDSTTNRKGLVVTLFKNSDWEIYNDLGGRTHDRDTITDVVKHVQNESLNTIVINNRNIIKTTDNDNNKYYIRYKDYKDKVYVTYFLYINERIDDMYYNNMKIIESNDQICSTTGIKRFFISDIEKCLKHKTYNKYKDIQCQSTDGELNYIYNATLCSIEMMLEHNRCYKFIDNIINNPPKNIKTEIYKKNNMSNCESTYAPNCESTCATGDTTNDDTTRSWRSDDGLEQSNSQLFNTNEYKNTEISSFYGTTSLIIN